MEDSVSGSEEDHYYSSDGEAESLDGIEKEDSDAQCASTKASSCKVITKESLGSTGVTADKFVDSDPLEPSSTMMCNICMDDVPAQELTTMECGHCFCDNCWTEHFVVKINEGQSKRIKCMAHKCNAVCDEVIVRKLLSIKDPDLAEKF